MVKDFYSSKDMKLKNSIELLKQLGHEPMDNMQYCKKCGCCLFSWKIDYHCNYEDRLKNGWIATENERPEKGFEVQVLDFGGRNRIMVFVNDRWYYKDSPMGKDYFPAMWRYRNPEIIKKEK